MYTKGKWIASQFDPDSPRIVVSESGEWVCKVSSSRDCAGRNWANQSTETERANARLIAAAPELLSLLKIGLELRKQDEKSMTEIISWPKYWAEVEKFTAKAESEAK